MLLSNVSIIKKISLILGRKAYLVYTDNPIPSLLIPVPSIDNAAKSAIYKTFSDLTNDQILTFHNKTIAQKDLNNIQREHHAKLNIDQMHIPQQVHFDSIESIEIKPESMFLAVNQIDHSLVFMQYSDLQSNTLTANTNPQKDIEDIEKPKTQPSNQNKGPEKVIKKSELIKQNKELDERNGQKDKQFVNQKEFEKEEISTWNEESPQLSTPNQPKQDQYNVHINKFIPLAYLTDNIVTKPIQIIHIQTSRQYLFLQFLKLFCIANILCVYGLVTKGTRSQNHDQIRNKGAKTETKQRQL